MYRHWSPPAVDQLLLRGEWYTAYTPYQPEVSQGTLQSIYEYESLIAELVDLDVVSASHYDGAAATAEAALMTCRATRRGRVLVSRGVHPHYRATTADLLRGRPRARRDPAAWPTATPPGRPTSPRWSGCSPTRTARSPASSPPSPNFFGLLEPMPEIGRLAHAAGALFVAVVEPVCLAVLAPPGAYGADIAAGEGQPLGIAPQYGGPYLGILASTDALVRQIPGRLVGMTTDLDGQARVRHDDAGARAGHPARQGGEQHLHQPGAPRAGRVDLPRHARPARAARRRGARARRGRPSSRRRSPRSASSGCTPGRTSTSSPSGSRTRGPSTAGCSRRGILAGLVLADAEPDDPSLADGLLVCATEVTTSDEIVAFAGALSAVLGHHDIPAAPAAVR